MSILRESVGVGAADTATPWSMSWSHTTAGGGPVLICFALEPSVSGSLERNTIIPSATWNGQQATLLAYRNVGTNDAYGTEFCFIYWGATAGTFTVAVFATVSGGATATVLHGNSVLYTGVGGVHAIYGEGKAPTTSQSFTAPTEIGRMYVHLGATAGTTFSGYSQTVLYSDTTDSQFFCIGEAAGTGGDVTFSWTSASSGSAHLVIELVPDNYGLVFARGISLVARNFKESTVYTLSASCSQRVDYTDANTIAVVGVAVSTASGAGGDTVTATFNGASMTEWDLVKYSSGTDRGIVCLFYVWNPPLGLSTVNITASGGTGVKKHQVIGGCAVFSNVDSITTPSTSSSSSVTVSPTDIGERLLVMTGNFVQVSRPTQNEIVRHGAGLEFGLANWASFQEAVGDGGSVTLGNTVAAGASNPRSMLGRLKPKAAPPASSGFFAFF